MAGTRIVRSLLLLLALTATAALAQTPETTVQLEIPAAAEAGPDFDVQAATQAYLDLISPEERAKSDAYFEGGYWLILWSFLYGLGVAWLLLATRISARMRDWAERVSAKPSLQTALYAVQYILAVAVLSFPLTVYQGFVREHQYDLATQTFGPWFGDQVTGLFVTVLFGALSLMVIYALIRRFPRSWWISGSVAAVGFLILGNAIAPVYILPLFNDYQPLEEGPLQARILSLARANGVPAEDVYWFDASRQTTRISANVSGALGTTRIALNDNLLERTSPEEIEAVMAHEIAHYALNHVWELVIYFGLVIVVGFAFVQWSFVWAHARWAEGWGIRDVGDTAGLPLLLACLSVYFFVMTPVTNSIIRQGEVEADIYGLNAARQPDGFARVAMRLAEYRKIDPSPLEEVLFFTHPSGRARVEMAMGWKAEMLRQD